MFLDAKTETWPLPAEHLVYVRHGESEGNVLFEGVQSSDLHVRERAYETIRRAPNRRLWKLTAKGRAQAHAAGKWLRDHADEFLTAGELSTGKRRRSTPPPRPLFEMCLASSFCRAVETAVALGRETPLEITDFLVERDWGDYDCLGRLLEDRFPHAHAALRKNPFNWTPANGESFPAILQNRIAPIIALIAKRRPKRALIVAHADLFWGYRYALEGMSISEFNAAYLDQGTNAMPYAQITHYTRVNPRTREIEPPGTIWVRAIDPMRPDVPRRAWQKIERISPGVQAIARTG